MTASECAPGARPETLAGFVHARNGPRSIEHWYVAGVALAANVNAATVPASLDTISVSGWRTGENAKSSTSTKPTLAETNASTMVGASPGSLSTTGCQSPVADWIVVAAIT